MAKKEKKGVPYAREKKDFLQATGNSGEARHNPKAPANNAPPYQRKKVDWLEETGTDDHPRFRTGK